MASIMCGQKLWRALLVPEHKRTKRATIVVEQPIFQNVIFGPWASALGRFDGHDVVIALDAAAHLTVVFRFGPREQFRSDFAKALGAALEDLAVASRTVTLETSVTEFMPVVRLADVTLSRILDDVQFRRPAHQRRHGVVTGGDPVVREALEIVGWDAYVIGAKLHRALDGRDRFQHDDEDCDSDPAQNDWNGSAKVALISLERTEVAWRVIGDAIGDSEPEARAGCRQTLIPARLRRTGSMTPLARVHRHVFI